MERVAQNSSDSVSVTFEEDGAVVDPGTVTVTIVRADGTVVATAQPTTGTGAAARAYTLTPAQTAQLDNLALTWNSPTKGARVTTAEVVGSLVFSVAELRALNPQLANTSTYPASAVTAMRTTVEDALEDELGFAMVPRYAEATFGGRPRWPLQLKPYLRTVRALSTVGTALSPSDVAALPFDENGFLYGGFGGSYSWWVDGEPRLSVFGPVVVGYEHGMDRPPERLRRAALLLAKVWLTSGPVDDRTNTFTSTDGGTFSLVTPGRGGSIFGVPEVDAAVQSARLVAVA